MKISIIIPCFNEINTIEKINKKVQDTFINYDFEIVIIDDYSNDGSKDLLKKKFLDSDLHKIIFNNKNYGKGYSLNEGFKKAVSTIIDANLTTFIAAFALFIFGSGPIKGFSVTLMIGLVTSMYTAIVLTRFLIIKYISKS